MATTKYISIEEFADFHHVTTKLVHEFADFGLIEISHSDEKLFIPSDYLDKCERVIRLHRDLGVNKEGIEIILEMRQKHAELQSELLRLRRKISKYEDQLSQLFSEDFN